MCRATGSSPRVRWLRTIRSTVTSLASLTAEALVLVTFVL
jgi:hypothetical protein